MVEYFLENETEPFANSMKTRKARLADSLFIAHLTSQLGYPADDVAINKRLSRILARDDHAVHIAEEDSGCSVGWIQSHMIDILESGIFVEIRGLIVADNARRRGAGRLLVGCAEEWAFEKGAEMLVARSNIRRSESHVFYPSLGFTETKTQTVYRKIISNR